ncbi:MAG: RnfABCDGE type electron transport complex subunit B [bacterium]
MLSAIVSITGLGFIAALGLGIASKKFHVDIDPRLETLESILPGLNCGACGYPGCAGFAEGLLAGSVGPADCAPGGQEVVDELSDFLGLEVVGVVKKVSVLKCGGGRSHAKVEAEYEGIRDCRAAVLLGGGGKSCRYSCVGFATCEFVCPFDAIKMSDEDLPIIDPDLCTSCGKCVEACPRDVLVLEPAVHKVIVRCYSPQPGKIVKSVCSVGCIGCGICEKVCPVDAITQEDNLAYIDPDACIECGICASKCPTDSITDDMLPRTTVLISDECNGCGICAKICPYEAAQGELKQLHEIDPAQCTGCGLCPPRCPVDAISFTGPKAVTIGDSPRTEE